MGSYGILGCPTLVPRKDESLLLLPSVWEPPVLWQLPRWAAGGVLLGQSAGYLCQRGALEQYVGCDNQKILLSVESATIYLSPPT